jgi:hypothetical protein
VATASLGALSCPTAAWCMSVGSSTGSQGVQQPLAEIWTAGACPARLARSPTPSPTCHARPRARARPSAASRRARPVTAC